MKTSYIKRFKIKLDLLWRSSHCCRGLFSWQNRTCVEAGNLHTLHWLNQYSWNERLKSNESISSTIGKITMTNRSIRSRFYGNIIICATDRHFFFVSSNSINTTDSFQIIGRIVCKNDKTRAPIVCLFCQHPCSRPK